MKRQIRLAGTGGQGQILAGIILAEAAVVHDGLHAVQSQSYGPESRGGASRAEVIISDEPIDYPKVMEADLLLCMSQEAYDRYAEEIAEQGVLLVDSSLVQPGEPSDRVLQVPITKMAEEKLGRSIVANVLALGILVGLTSAVSEEAAREAVAGRVPPGTEELNLKALELGLSVAEDLRQ
ncbi:MAG: 2-oxoacid:acceptor oxidoreductase family protein [Bacillota bacterium]